MVECTQSTPYKLDTASSKPNILHASIVDTADIPRDAAQFGVTVSRVKVGKVDVEKVAVDVGAERVVHVHVNCCFE